MYCGRGQLLDRLIASIALSAQVMTEAMYEPSARNVNLRSVPEIGVSCCVESQSFISGVPV